MVTEVKIQTGARLAGVKGKAKPSGSRKALKWQVQVSRFQRVLRLEANNQL